MANLKYKDPTTSTFKNLLPFSLEANDVPIGTIVDYNGDSVPDGWEEISGTDVYSTTETKTNKIWIDGKPIYRKVISTGAISSTTKSIAHNISNFSTLTSFRGFAYYGSNTYLLPSVTYGALNNLIGVIINKTSITLDVGSDANFDNSIVILEYTKTTD